MAKMRLFQGEDKDTKDFKTFITVFDDTHSEFPIMEVQDGVLEFKLFNADDMRLEEMGFPTEIGDDGYKTIKQRYVPA
jgi:hypothetical protein